MSDKNVTRFKQILTDNGYSLTQAREVTFDLLVSAEPQSIRQVMAHAAGRVDRVSVYRNVELFERLGIVHRIYVGWKYKLELSDEFMAHHHHMSCLQCGRIIDIRDERHIDDFIRKIAQEYSFKPRSHQFEIAGYCQDCANVN